MEIIAGQTGCDQCQKEWKTVFFSNYGSRRRYFDQSLLLKLGYLKKHLRPRTADVTIPAIPKSGNQARIYYPELYDAVRRVT